MKCPACQTENRDGAKFCDECGASLTSSQSIPPTVSPESASQNTGSEAPSPEIEEFSSPADIFAEEKEALRTSFANEPLPSFAGFDEGVDEAGETPDTAEGGTVPDAAKTCDLSGLKQMVDVGYTSMEGDALGSTKRMEPVEASDAPETGEPRKAQSFIANNDKKAKKKGRKKHARRVAIAAVCAVAVVAAGFGITYWMELWGGKTVPNVAGESQANATYVLEERGFNVKTSTVKSDDVEGIVLLTDPSIGTRAEAGSDIVVHISSARVVPELVGKMRAEAEALLSKEGFKRVSFVEFRSDEPAGTILEVSPEPGTKGKAALPINVSVAVPYTVPQVAGMASADAQAAIVDGGYSVNVATVISDEVSEGCAAYTEPAEGEELKSGSAVTLYVAVSPTTHYESLTWNYLGDVGTVEIDGESYQIDSIDDVAYTNESSCEFVITGRLVAYSSDGHKLLGVDSQTVRAYITYDDGGNIIAIQNAANVA